MPSFDEYKAQGNLAFSKKEFKRAAKIYRDAIAQYGDNPVLFSNRAQCFLNLQDWERAYRDAKAGLECKPTNNIKVKLLFRMGLAAMNKSLESEAERCFQEVLALDKSNKGAREELDKLMTEPKFKKFKAGSHVIPLEIVDELPKEFAEIVSLCSATSETKKEVNLDLVNSVSDELFGSSNDQKKSVKIEECDKQDFSHMPSMHFLTALKSVPQEKKEKSYHYVTTLDDETLVTLFKESGIDHEFFEFYIEACVFVIVNENSGRAVESVFEKLRLMSSFTRFSLSVTMCDEKLLTRLFAAVETVSPHFLEQFSQVLNIR